MDCQAPSVNVFAAPANCTVSNACNSALCACTGSSAAFPTCLTSNTGSCSATQACYMRYLRCISSAVKTRSNAADPCSTLGTNVHMAQLDAVVSEVFNATNLAESCVYATCLLANQTANVGNCSGAVVTAAVCSPANLIGGYTKTPTLMVPVFSRTRTRHPTHTRTKLRTRSPSAFKTRTITLSARATATFTATFNKPHRHTKTKTESLTLTRAVRRQRTVTLAPPVLFTTATAGSLLDGGNMLYLSLLPSNFTFRRIMIVQPAGSLTVPTVSTSFLLRSEPLFVLAEVAASTSTTFDYVSFNKAKCSYFHNTSSSTPPCYLGRICDMNTASVAAGTGRLVVAGGPVFSSPSTTRCDSNVYLFAAISTDARLATLGTYSAVTLSTLAGPSSTSYTLTGVTAAAAYLSWSATKQSYDASSSLLSAASPGASAFVTCTYGDITSFAVYRNATPAGAPYSCTVTLSSGGSRSCATVAEYHAQCALDVNCIGYTTTLTGTTEVGVSLYATPYGFSLTVTTPMNYHQKPPSANRTCTFIVDPSSSDGYVAVSVAQTFLASAWVEVYVTLPNGRPLLKKQCGALQPFARNIRGTDSNCRSLVLCYDTGLLPAGSTVSVTASHNLGTSSCDWSLATLVNFTRAPPGVTPAPTIAYANPIDVTGMSSRAVYIPLSTASSTYPKGVVNLLWRNITSVALKVLQTGWDCSSGRTIACPATAVSYSVDTSSPPIATCAGLAGFADGAGAGAQCQLYQDCVAQASLTASQKSSSATITVNMTVLTGYTPPFTLADSCMGFSATVYFNATTSDPFPVLASTSFSSASMRPLIAVLQTAKSNTADQAASLLQRTGQVSLAPVITVSPANGNYDIFAPRTGSGAPLVLTQPGLPFNITMACILDHTAGVASTCTLPIPIGTNHIAVRVQQSDFAARSVSVAVLNQAGTEHTMLSKTCGGGVLTPFNGKAGLAGACEQYLTCSSTFLQKLTAGSTATGNATYDFATLVITIPGLVQPRGCSTAFSALVDFAAYQVEDVSGCKGYICLADLKCISNSSVCDGSVRDCSDGADEATCGQFKQVEVDHTVNTHALAPLWDTSLPPSALVSDCKWLAVFTGGRAFSFYNGGSAPRCSVFSTSATALLQSTPSAYIANLTGSAIYSIIAYTSQYRRCNSFLYCSGGNGAIKGGENLPDGSQCTCVCDNQHIGSDCSVTKSMTAVGQYYAIAPTAASSNDPAAMASALAGGNSAITATVTAYRVWNSTAVAIPFAAVGSDSDSLTQFLAAIYSASFVSSVNALLAQYGLPGISYVTAVDALSVPTPIGDCTGLSCSNVVRQDKKPVTSLAVSTGGVATPFVVSFAASSSHSRRQDANTTVVNFTCASNDTVTTGPEGNCPSHTCVLGSLNFNNGLSGVRIAAVNSSMNTSTTSDSGTTCPVSLGLQSTPAPAASLPVFVQQLFDPIVNTSAPVVYLGIAGVLAVMFVGFVLGVAVVAVYWAKRLRNTRRLASLSKKFRLSMLAPWARAAITHATHTGLLRRLNLQQVALAFAVIVVMSIGVAGAMTILYATQFQYLPTTAVVIALYRSESCGNGIATLPFLVAMTPVLGPSSCSLVTTVGQDLGEALYAKATCEKDASGTGYHIATAFASTERECAAMSAVAVVNGSALASTCVPFSRVVSQTLIDIGDGVGFFTPSCMPLDNANAVIASFKTVAPQVNTSTPLQVSTPPATMALNQQPAAAEGSRWPTTDDSGALQFSTSSVLGRVASIGKVDDFWGDTTTGARLLSQVIDSPSMTIFDSDPSALFVNLTAALEAQAKPLLATSNLTTDETFRSVAPEDEDFPVGFLFNQFNTANAAKGAAAYAGAQRYVGVAGTAFDIGTKYGPGATGEEDGFAISMWMRVTRATEGFAFVLSDHLEVKTTRESLVVTKLSAVADGAGVGEWFASSIHVYASLYVAGPSETISFMMATPPTDPKLNASWTERVAKLADLTGSADSSAESDVDLVTWDLAALGQDALFNGAWHHVAIVLMNVAEEPVARLILDGQTSTAVGWQKCLSHRPNPISVNQSATILIPDDVAADSVTSLDGGVLYVGYFNGGLRGLTFAEGIARPFEYIREGTRALKLRNAAPVTSLHALAYGCLGFVILLVLRMLVYIADGLREVRRDAARSRAHLHRNWTQNAARVFPAAEGYPSISMSLARLLLCRYVAEDTMLQLLEYCKREPLELRSDGKSTAVTMVRIIWLLHHQEGEGDNNRSQTKHIDLVRACYPTPEEWATWIADERAKHLNELSHEESALITEGAELPLAEAREALSTAGGFGALVQNILYVSQAMLVFSTTFRFPADFGNIFLPLFKVLSFDFFTIAGVGEVTKLIFFYSVCTAAMVVLVFVVAVDQRTYFMLLLRYVVRRNTKFRFAHSRTSILSRLLLATDDEARFERCPYEYKVHLLNWPVRCFVHDMSADMQRGMAANSVVQSKTMSAPVFVHRQNKKVVTFGPSKDAAATALGAPLGVAPCCPEHPHSELLPIDQTEFAPFSGRYGCRAIVDGQPCHSREGILYVCHESFDLDGTQPDGQPLTARCNYALCSHHFSADLSATIKLAAKARLRRFIESGFAAFLARVVVFIAFSIYTPIMQNSFMVVTCHPSFQCQFPNCWSKIDVSFASTAYAALLAIAVVGVGFPVLLFWMLRARALAIENVFSARVYMRKFMDHFEPKAQHAIPKSFAARILAVISKSLRREAALQAAETKRMGVTRAPRVDGEVWNEFFELDESLLSKTYETFRPEFLTAAPIQMFARFIIIVPAIALDEGLLQYLLLAIGALLYAAAMDVMQPYRSRFVAVLDCVGIAFQLAVVGLQANFAASETRDPHAEAFLSTAMFASFITFLALSFAIALTMMLRELGWKALRHLRMRSAVRLLHLTDHDEVPAFLAPLAHGSPTQRVERNADDQSLRSSSIGSSPTASHAATEPSINEDDFGSASSKTPPSDNIDHNDFADWGSEQKENEEAEVEVDGDLFVEPTTVIDVFTGLPSEAAASSPHHHHNPYNVHVASRRHAVSPTDDAPLTASEPAAPNANEPVMQQQINLPQATRREPYEWHAPPTAQPVLYPASTSLSRGQEH